MRVDSYQQGVPSWVDHTSADPVTARSFYFALFGWEVDEGPLVAGGYALATLQGLPVAGIGSRQTPGPAVWNTYVNVDSADELLDRVADRAGRVVVAPMDVMDAGRVGALADPSGAVLGVWQPRAHRGAGLVNEPGTFCWSELLTTDVEGAKAFYPAVFGWEAASHGPTEGPGAYTEWRVNGRPFGGLMAMPPGMPPGVTPWWGAYFMVDDVDATVVRVQELGGKLRMGPRDISTGRRIATVADPLGASFNLIAVKPSGSG